MGKGKGDTPFLPPRKPGWRLESKEPQSKVGQPSALTEWLCQASLGSVNSNKPHLIQPQKLAHWHHTLTFCVAAASPLPQPREYRIHAHHNKCKTSSTTVYIQPHSQGHGLSPDWLVTWGIISDPPSWGSSRQ